MSDKIPVDVLSLCNFAISASILLAINKNGILTKENTLKIVDQAIDLLGKTENIDAKKEIDQAIVKLNQIKIIIDNNGI